MSEVTHGMVVVPTKLTRVEWMLLSTCLCGWFSSTLSHKPDLAAYEWRQHMGEDTE
jgi:hypothetical protein